MRATKRLPDGYKVSNELNYRYNVAYRKTVRPIAILLLFVYAWGFSITARLLRQDVPPFFESWPTMVIMWLLAMQLARIFHEGIHGAGLWLLTGVRPESEFSFENTYAVAPGWYLPYSAYLLVALAPLVGLTVIGFLLIPWVPNAVFFLTLAIITLNASWSTADVYLAGWTLAKSRADALVMYTQDWVRIYNRLDPIEGGGAA